MRLLVLLIVAAGMAAAQQHGWPRAPQANPLPPPTTTAPAVLRTGPGTAWFTALTTLVRVDAQVMERGRPVSGLEQKDFAVLEDGVPQTITNFGRDAEPLQVVLVLDVSGSMGRLLAEMGSVGTQALKVLGAEDQTAIVHYAAHSRVELEFTPDKLAAARLLKEAEIEHELGAGTDLNVALLDTAKWLKSLPPFAGRRALIVLTDNGGVSYQHPDDEVLRALGEVNAVVNAIVPPNAKEPAPPKKGADVNPDFTRANVFELARQTGGEVLKADHAGASFPEMMEMIRLRYSLGYRPKPAAPGTFHRIEVQLTDEARRRYPKAEVHARPGYYSAAIE